MFVRVLCLLTVPMVCTLPAQIFGPGGTFTPSLPAAVRVGVVSPDRLPVFSPRQNSAAILPAVILPQVQQIQLGGFGAVLPQFQMWQAQQRAMMWQQQLPFFGNQPFGMPFPPGPFQPGFGGGPMFGSPPFMSPMMYVVPMRVNPMDPANYLFGRY